MVIVLGAQNDARGRLSAMAVARAHGALDVYRCRSGTKLLVTGGYGRFNPAPQPHAHYMAAHLVEQGVDPGDILAQVQSAHTVEDAALTRQFLDAYLGAGYRDAPSTQGTPSLPVCSITVVTSEVHLARARLIFEHFYDPAQLTWIGTPDAMPPERLREIEAHEAEQVARIWQQGGVIYQGKLERRRFSHP